MLLLRIVRMLDESFVNLIDIYLLFFFLGSYNTPSFYATIISFTSLCESFGG